MASLRKTSRLLTLVCGATIGGGTVAVGAYNYFAPVSASETTGAPGVSAGKGRTIPPPSRSDLELKFVQVFFRHGARTPLGSMPNIEEGYWDKQSLFEGADDACIDYKVCALDGGPQPVWVTEDSYRKKPLKGGAFKGQLTARGMWQANDLGLLLKQHYIDNLGFLPTDFSPEVVYTRSTNINRSLQSLGCVMAGMYGKSIKPTQLPITFFVEEAAKEILYPNSGRCRQLKHHYKSVFADMFRVPGLKPATTAVGPYLKMTEEETLKMDFVQIRDDLTARIEHNIDVPQFLLPMLSVIDEHATKLIRFLIAGGDSSKKDIIRYSAGPAMDYIVNTLDAAHQRKIPYKLHLNSCHDTSLMTMLLALEAYDDTWPPLTAALVFELYQDKDGNSFVRTVYESKELRICRSKETLVPLETFKELLRPVCYTTEDYLDACKLDKEH